MTGIVYAIECNPTGRIYVGQANSPRALQKRWGRHRHSLTTGCHHSIKLQRAWDKYGSSSFEFRILEESIPLERLTEREQHYMDTLGGYTQGFNCTPVAACTRGVKQSAETIAKRVEKLRGLFKGRKHSAATIQKIREARAQQAPPSDESRKKIGDALRGRKAGPNPKKGCKGRSPSPETREKIAEALRGRVIAPEVVERMREAQLRPEVLAKRPKSLTPEHRKKLSEAHKGKPNNQLGLKRSEESRQRMSEAAKAYQQRKRLQQTQEEADDEG